MISRRTAEKTLSTLNYELHFIAPSREAYVSGKFMSVYLTNGVRFSHSYGDTTGIHGYIAPISWLHDADKLRQMIGYSGTIVVFNSSGDIV